eukprot:TRINITY_DN12718_c0_g1_i1.p1 TRINITY_DN12718_c0_g1~~TRINITY_DN12718_c0_g1_i1.p1  ORF type:complete len:1390 (+),score=379.30 TRINITY_DN12718_c0_g1_i1:77-4246(+)
MVLLGTIHPLEGDGINANFFDYLAKENKGLSSAEVWIPSTVIFEQGFAKAWYYSEKVVRKEGDSKRRVVEVKKRTGKECDLDVIKSHFIRDAKHEADLCGMFISHFSNDTSEGSQVRFFDKRTLREFLNPYVEKPKGLLQKFVRPKGHNNTVIQAIWSPTVLVTEARRNRYSLMDKHVDVFSRSATFEGSSENCVHIVVAPVVIDYIRAQCEQVVQHFFSTEHLNITRMVLYFKVDHQNTLRLLYSASVRIAEGSRRIQAAQSTENVPLNLAVRLRGHKSTARGRGVPSPARELAIRSKAFGSFLNDMTARMSEVKRTAPQASDYNSLATSAVLGGWTPPHYALFAARRLPSPQSKRRPLTAAPPSPSQSRSRSPREAQPARPRPQTQQSQRTAQPPAPAAAATQADGTAAGAGRPQSAGQPRRAAPSVGLPSPDGGAHLEAARRRAQPEPLQSFSHMLPNTDTIVARRRREAAEGQATQKQVEVEWESWLRQQVRQTAQLAATSPAPGSPSVAPGEHPAAAQPAAAVAAGTADTLQQPTSPAPSPQSHHYTYFLSSDKLDKPIHAAADNTGDGGKVTEEAEMQRQRKLNKEREEQEERRRKREEKEFYLLQEVQKHRSERGPTPLAVSPLAPQHAAAASPSIAASGKLLLTHSALAGAQPPPLPSTALAMRFEQAKAARLQAEGGAALRGVGSSPPRRQRHAQGGDGAHNVASPASSRPWIPGSEVSPCGSEPPGVGEASLGTLGPGLTSSGVDLPPLRSPGGTEVGPKDIPAGSGRLAAGAQQQQLGEPGRDPRAAQRRLSDRGPAYTATEPLQWLSVERQYAEALVARHIAAPGTGTPGEPGADQMVSALLAERAEQRNPRSVQTVPADGSRGARRRGTQRDQQGGQQRAPGGRGPAGLNVTLDSPQQSPGKSPRAHAPTPLATSPAGHPSGGSPSRGAKSAAPVPRSPRAARDQPGPQPAGADDSQQLQAPAPASAPAPPAPNGARPSTQQQRRVPSATGGQLFSRPRRGSHARPRQVEDWAGLSEDDVRRIEEEATEACAEVLAFLPELVYTIYSSFVQRKHCDTAELASGACDFYLEPPASLAFLLTPQVLHGLLHKLHGRLVSTERHCLQDERPEFVYDSEDEATRPATAQTGLPWPIGPGKRSLPIAPPKRKKLNPQQLGEKERRRERRKEMFIQETEERIRTRRAQLLDPCLKGAIARWAPKQDITIAWETNDAGIPELRPGTQGVVIPYQPNFIPIAKGESGGIVADVAEDVTAPHGRLYYEAKKYFYYQRLSEIEGERAAEARRRHLEQQEAEGLASDDEEAQKSTHDPQSPHQHPELDAMPHSICGMPMPGAAVDVDLTCGHCGCVRVLCLCDMTRVGGRFHHRVCKRKHPMALRQV